LLTVVFGILFLLVPAAVQSAAPADPDIIDELKRNGQAEVFVSLREPPLARGLNLAAQRRARRAVRAATLAAVSPEDVQVRHALTTAGAFSAAVSASGLAYLLAQPAVVRVDPMRYGAGAAEGSVAQIRADAVQRRDDRALGVTVALLDAGVDVTHPDLAGSVIDEECFCSDGGGCCPDGSMRQTGPGSAATSIAHGTHVAGTIVSKGFVAPVGVAPAAKMVAIKVLNEQNRGLLLDWIRALAWIADSRPDVQVINMSLASDSVFAEPCNDADGYNAAFAQMIGVLRDRGTLTFVAAGNNGTDDALASPACVDAAVAVGAVTGGDRVANFSNSSVGLDLLAPGVSIVSAGPGHSTDVLSGTSMATPHATGTAALMLALNPALGADQLEQLLKTTGVSITDPRNGLAVPRLDALAAMSAVLNATSPVLGGGRPSSDCLVVWRLTPPNLAAGQTPPAAVCHDGDPTCDHDDIPGQCTFQMGLCFNAVDPRLPRCRTDAPIVALHLASPNGRAPSDLVDALNVVAVSRALPAVPLTDSNWCTAAIPFIVPAEGAATSRSVRLWAHAADGRTDSDLLRLTCLPHE